MTKKKLVFLVYFFLNIFSVNTLWAEIKHQYSVLQDLNSEIIVFDDYYNSYVPLIPSKSSKYLSGHLWLDVQKFRGNFLQFAASPHLSIFINGKFFKSYSTFSEEKIPVNQLISYSQSNRKVFVSFYNHTGVWPKNINITVPVQSFDFNNNEESQILPREINYFNQFLVQVFFIVVLFIAILKMFFSKTFFIFYSFLNYFRRNNDIDEDDIILASTINKESFTFMFVNCFICSFSIMILFHAFSPDFLPTFFKGLSYWHIWIIQSFFFMLLYFIKYVLILINGLIYKLEKYTEYHFFIFASFIQKIGIFIFIFSMLFSNTLSTLSIDFNGPMLNFALVFTVILFFIVVFYKLRHLHKFTNFYLFSYLCITEAVPILLFYKLYLAS